jgi:hypothetical protein
MTSPFTTSDDVAFTFTGVFSNLRASVVQQLYAIWFSMPDYRDSDMNSWMDAALPIIRASEETAAQATLTYLQMQLEFAGLDDQLDLPPLDDITGDVLRGVPPEVVYQRPFKELWESLSKGNDYQTAIEDGANRLRQLIETDLQLTHTHTSRTVLSGRNDVVGFRRVPTGAYTCALCLIASTQRYHKLDLMPIHPGCDCRVAPIIGAEDPGQIVDPDLLENIHKRVEEMFGKADRSGKDYNKLLVVHDHGEYGPTLAKADNRFTFI